MVVGFERKKDAESYRKKLQTRYPKSHFEIEKVEGGYEVVGHYKFKGFAAAPQKKKKRRSWWRR